MTDDTWMDEATCWAYLRGEDLGRLGYHLVDEVHIVPVNYVVDGQRLVFRTTPGSKLLGIVMDSDVAFEIDGLHGDDVAWSVLARGRGRVLEGEERRRAEELPLRPWTSGAKHTLVGIDVESVTGRRMGLTNREVPTDG